MYAEICQVADLRHADQDKDVEIIAFCAGRGVTILELWHQVCHNSSYRADLVARAAYRILCTEHGLEDPPTPATPLTPAQVQRWLDVFQPDFVAYQSDRGYNTVRGGYISSFEGTYLTCREGQVYLVISHRPEGDAYRVTRQGYIERVAVGAAADPHLATKIAEVLNQCIGYGSHEIQAALALKIVAGGAAL